MGCVWVRGKLGHAGHSSPFPCLVFTNQVKSEAQFSPISLSSLNLIFPGEGGGAKFEGSKRKVEVVKAF